MTTRHQTVRVNGRSRGVLDALGGRTLRLLDPPAAGSGVIRASIVESGRAVWLQIERDDAGAIDVKNVFDNIGQALFYYVGDLVSVEVMEMLTDEERNGAMQAARESEVRGEPGLVGIDRWAQHAFGKRLIDVVQERFAQRQHGQEGTWLAPGSGTVH